MKIFLSPGVHPSKQLTNRASHYKLTILEGTQPHVQLRKSDIFLLALSHPLEGAGFWPFKYIIYY